MTAVQTFCMHLFYFIYFIFSLFFISYKEFSRGCMLASIRIHITQRFARSLLIWQPECQLSEIATGSGRLRGRREGDTKRRPGGSPRQSTGVSLSTRVLNLSWVRPSLSPTCYRTDRSFDTYAIKLVPPPLLKTEAVSLMCTPDATYWLT